VTFTLGFRAGGDIGSYQVQSEVADVSGQYSPVSTLWPGSTGGPTINVSGTGPTFTISETDQAQYSDPDYYDTYFTLQITGDTYVSQTYSGELFPGYDFTANASGGSYSVSLQVCGAYLIELGLNEGDCVTSNEVDFDYEPPPQTPTLQILRNGSIISGPTQDSAPTQNIIAGQWMSLTASVSNTNGATPTFQWTVPSAGTAVGWISSGNWSSSDGPDPIPPTALQTYNLAPPAGATSPTGFAWTLPNNGTPYTASVTATLNGTPLSPAYANFNVTAPSISGVAIELPPSIAQTCASSGWSMCLGGGTPGIQFNLSPPGCLNQGYTCEWVQIVGAGTAIDYTDTSGNMSERNVSGGLDGNGPLGLGISQPNDSPSVPLAGYQEAVAVENFTAYLMVKPAGANSIFVPASYIPWSWGGDAVLSGGYWNVRSPQPASTANIAGTPAASYPTWGQQNTSGSKVPYPSITSLSITPSQAQVGSSPTITITLSGPAPTLGARISLTSDTIAAFSVPATCTVPAGQLSATCAGSALAASAEPVTVTASLGGSAQTATVTVGAQQ
jgi:hypothetical protein